MEKKFKKENRSAIERLIDEMSKCFSKYSKTEIEEYRAYIKRKINDII